MAMHVQQITDREVFVGLDPTEQVSRTACAEGCGIDPSKGLLRKREMAQLVKAWSTAKVHAETQTRVNAVSHRHGEPASMLNAHWQSLLDQFRAKYGEDMHKYVSPAQSFHEAFEEQLSHGCPNAQTPAHVVKEEREQVMVCSN